MKTNFDTMGQVIRDKSPEEDGKINFMFLVKSMIAPGQSVFPLPKQEDYIPKGYYYFNKYAQENIKNGLTDIEEYIRIHGDSYLIELDNKIVSLGSIVDVIKKSIMFSNDFLDSYKTTETTDEEQDEVRKTIRNRLLGI